MLAPYQEKRLCDIVMPGSHDAGIFGNLGTSAKTQSLDIGGQANEGVRWFDLRFAGQSNILSSGNTKIRAYHGAGPEIGPKHKIKNTVEHHGSVLANKNVKTKAMLLGDWGGELDLMLTQARDFVVNNRTEFLIFKVSKSQNIDLVSKRFREVLGTKAYINQGKVNLNTCKVKDLAGHVIMLTDEKSINKIHEKQGNDMTAHLFPYKELFDSDKKIIKGYDKNYRGLQYIGKYSNTRKVDENVKGQKKMFDRVYDGPATNPDALGVMYWTLTTQKNPTALIDKNIESRNTAQLWSEEGVKKLKNTFGSMLYSAVRLHMQNLIGQKKRNDWKLFLPNVILMDFANQQRCNEIYALNNTVNELVQLYMQSM